MLQEKTIISIIVINISYKKHGLYNETNRIAYFAINIEYIQISKIKYGYSCPGLYLVLLKIGRTTSQKPFSSVIGL